MRACIWVVYCVGLLCVCGSAAGQVKAFDQGVGKAAQSLREEKNAQKVIDNTDEHRREIWAEHDALERELLALRAYRQHRQQSRDQQGKKLQDLRAQLDRVDETRAGLVPLLLRMLDGLNPIVATPPFAIEQRKQRLTDIAAASLDPELDLGEQFRRVLATYFAELDFAVSIDTARTQLEFGGERIAGDLIRLGRLELYFISLDSKLVLIHSDDKWRRLPQAYAVLIQRARRVAAKRAAPGYLELPIHWAQGHSR